MVKGVGLNAEAELEAVGARIDRWRRTRSKRGAMPEELWLAAMALSERLGVHPVSQRLKLNYDRLKLRLVESELQQARAESAAGVPAGFVELRRNGLVCDRHAAVAEVELARPDGARMTLRMAGEQSLDLAQLAEAFFGEGP